MICDRALGLGGPSAANFFLGGPVVHAYTAAGPGQVAACGAHACGHSNAITCGATWKTARKMAGSTAGSNVLDEFTHESLGAAGGAQIEGHRRNRRTVRPVHRTRGPAHIRSEIGPEIVAAAVREWIAAVGAKSAYIAPDSPWENDYIESLNARLRDELLEREIFYSLKGPRS